MNFGGLGGLADKVPGGLPDGIPGMPQLSLAQAKELATKAIAQFMKPENKGRLEKAVKESNGDPAKKMATVLPIVQEITNPILVEYGFKKGATMPAIMAIQAHAANDPKLKAQCDDLKNKFMGNI